MKRSIVLLALLFATFLQAGMAIVPGDEQYYSSGDERVEYIYTEQNRYGAEQAMRLEPYINFLYQQSFGFSMDSKMYVGLPSQQNQVANGFSTQYPVNMQIDYMGGALSVDVSATTSWLNSLLYHETAHNYQINAKASKVTQSIDDVLGTSYLLLWFFPLTSIPNVTISSFLLEGNAVLNESVHGNGGRLYSGRFKAESILQAKAGHINAPFLYNQDIGTFPYYDRHYIVGGFFQNYLAETYGLKKVNTFFYNHSKSWLWPFRINHVFEITFGVDYETALSGFEKWLLAKGEGFVKAEGKVLETSAKFSPLNANCDKIFFLTSNAYQAPEQVTLFKKDKFLKKERKSFFQNRLINSTDRYYTQSSGFVSASERYIGLYDDEGRLKEGSDSKVIQGYLHGGVPVYFDIPSSFDQPQLYVGETFYAQVNSSVVIDVDDNLYYFVQEGKTRTLFKNHTALYSYESFYGLVSDVDSTGAVYFIANSAKGSSLYRYRDHEVVRVSAADNVIDARLLNDDEVLLAAVGEENYYYLINPLVSLAQAPYEERLFFEDKKDDVLMMVPEKDSRENVNLDNPYYAPLRTEYAGTELALGAVSKNKKVLLTYNVEAAFIDPLLSNRYALFSRRGADEVGTVGASYDNNAHLLSFGARVYGVYDGGDVASYHLYSEANNSYSKALYMLQQKNRDYGVSAYGLIPFLKRGYEQATVALKYYQDYDDNARSPLVFSLDLSHKERFFQAMENNYLQALSLFSVYDRNDLSYGGNYRFEHDLPERFYISAALKGVHSDYERNTFEISSENYTRGVKFANFESALFQDPATVVMPSLEYTRFVKQAVVAEVGLKKQFNATLLFFTFPFSLTRELFYVKQRHYNIQDFGQSGSWREHTTYNESTAGLSLEMLVMNRLRVPIHMEYLYNDHTKEKNNFRMYIGKISF